MATKKKKRERVFRGLPIRRRPRRLTKAQIASKIKRALTPRFSVECAYMGLDHAVDRALEKAARKRSDGSGMWLGVGLRDVEFDFRTLEQASIAAERIKGAKILGPDGTPVRVMMRGYWKA